MATGEKQVLGVRDSHVSESTTATVISAEMMFRKCSNPDVTGLVYLPFFVLSSTIWASSLRSSPCLVDVSPEVAGEPLRPLMECVLSPVVDLPTSGCKREDVRCAPFVGIVEVIAFRTEDLEYILFAHCANK